MRALPVRAFMSAFVLASLLSFDLLSVQTSAAEPAPTPMSNPLLTESTLPYHLPPFATIKDEHFAPAF